MAIRKHIHKLRRKTYRNKEQVYFCILDCDYKVSTALSLGKLTICNRCGKHFEMNEYSCRLAKPHCNSCTNTTEDSPILTVKIPILDTQIGEKSIDSETEDLKARLEKAIGISSQQDSDDIL